MDKYPESVKALADAGHEVMSHSNTHAHFNSLSAQEIIDDLNACGDKIEGVTGARPTLFRCPYGEYDDHVINAVRSMGIEPIQWDVERSQTASSDWSAGDSGVWDSKRNGSYRDTGGAVLRPLHMKRLFARPPLVLSRLIFALICRWLIGHPLCCPA